MAMMEVKLYTPFSDTPVRPVRFPGSSLKEAVFQAAKNLVVTVSNFCAPQATLVQLVIRSPPKITTAVGGLMGFHFITTVLPGMMGFRFFHPPMVVVQVSFRYNSTVMIALYVSQHLWHGTSQNFKFARDVIFFPLLR